MQAPAVPNRALYISHFPLFNITSRARIKTTFLAFVLKKVPPKERRAKGALLCEISHVLPEKIPSMVKNQLAENCCLAQISYSKYTRFVMLSRVKEEVNHSYFIRYAHIRKAEPRGIILDLGFHAL